eukprot:2447901-Alexandrium_andersonii.AAC.1
MLHAQRATCRPRQSVQEYLCNTALEVSFAPGSCRRLSGSPPLCSGGAPTPEPPALAPPVHKRR